MVTNATMMTEERLLHLHRLGIRLCISLDGPPHINDKIRGGGQKVDRGAQPPQPRPAGLAGVEVALERGSIVVGQGAERVGG